MAPRLIAIVRGVPNSFCDALSLNPPPQPVSLDRARVQHAAYVKVLQELVQEVIQVPADDKYPDCPFIEDTAVVIGNKALITYPGAASRRGEEVAIRKTLQQLGIDISEVESPGAKIDGGDVLYASGMLFAGKSRRTNAGGLEALQKAFPDVKVHTIPVVEGLHLKSALTKIAPQTLAVEDSEAATAMFEEIQLKTDGHFKMVRIRGAGAANTVLVGGTVICSATLGLGAGLKSQYEQHANHVIPVDISEFHKMDGGLTCLSLLIER